MTSSREKKKRTSNVYKSYLFLCRYAPFLYATLVLTKWVACLLLVSGTCSTNTGVMTFDAASRQSFFHRHLELSHNKKKIEWLKLKQWKVPKSTKKKIYEACTILVVGLNLTIQFTY